MCIIARFGARAGAFVSCRHQGKVGDIRDTAVMDLSVLAGTPVVVCEFVLMITRVLCAVLCVWSHVHGVPMMAHSRSP